MAGPDIDALVANAEREIASVGSIALAKLGPKAVRADVARALASRGFEVGKTRVERPARDRVRALLAEGAFLPVAALGTRVKGLGASRAKALAAELVARGEAKRVLRTTTETLVPAREPALDEEEVAALGAALTALARTCAAASKKRAGLLRVDVESALERIRRAAGEAPGGVDAAIARLADPTTGLAFVPRVVDALAPMRLAAAHAALLEAEREGRVELRPEGGLARLSAAERDACVPGPAGSVLSWARLVPAREVRQRA
ncbi:MAG: hypothetical protein U0414_39025 [Polyangiaceae bacterium]